jgi:flagellar motor switch/type III secretory pathway protein FliN
LPFPVRALRPGEAGERRRLLRGWPVSGRVLELPRLGELLGGESRLVFDALEPVDRVAAPAPALALALADGGGPRIVLGLPLALARRMVDLALGRPATPGDAVLTTGEEGALLFALDRAAGDWIDAGGVRFEIRGPLHDVGQGAALLPAGTIWRGTSRLGIPGREDRVWLWRAAPGSGAGVRDARGLLDPLPAGVADWPAEIGIEVGDSRLALAAIGDLAPGDLVVLDHLAHPEGATGAGDARLVSGAFTRSFRWLDATRFQLVSPTEGRRPMGVNENRPDPVRAGLAPVIEESAAPDVQVRVEVARVRMTVGQATGLLPGQIVELDRPVGAEVVLCVGDGRIAAGVLVEHEGELAVEITEVS